MAPFAGGYLFSQRSLYERQEDAARQETLQHAVFLESDLSQLVSGVRQAHSVLTELPRIREGNSPACSELLKRMVARDVLTNNILVSDAQGNVWCDGVLGPERITSISIADRDYFQNARSTDRFAVGGYAIGRSTQTPVIHLATPFHDDAGRFAGVVVTAVDLHELARRLDRPIWRDGRATLIADREGIILVRHPDNPAFVGRRMPPKLHSLLDEVRPGNVETRETVDRVPRILGYVPPAANPGGLYVGVGTTKALAFGLLRETNMIALATLLLAGAMAAVLAWLIADRMLRQPVQKLLATSERWRAGDLSARSGLQGSDELGQLGRAFDEMAADLERLVQRKQLLLRELAHRTMNNLQVLSSLLIMQRRGAPDETSRDQLNRATARVQAMAMAYRSLHSSGGGGSIDFGEMLHQLCGSLEESFLTGEARCRVTASSLVVGAESAMPMALVANELVTNAIKHGGAETIFVHLRPEQDHWKLTVRNAGELPPDFDLAQTQGFGLKMVRSMVGEAGGEVTFRSAEGWTECTVTFLKELRPSAATTRLSAATETI